MMICFFDWTGNSVEEVSLFAYYRLEYDELETASLDSSRVRTTTEMAGGKYRFHHDWEFVAAYRKKSLGDAADNSKMKVYGELVYSLNDYISIAPGYEHSRYDSEDGDDEYKADVLYINLIGKL